MLQCDTHTHKKRLLIVPLNLCSLKSFNFCLCCRKWWSPRSPLPLYLEAPTARPHCPRRLPLPPPPRWPCTHTHTLTAASPRCPAPPVGPWALRACPVRTAPCSKALPRAWCSCPEDSRSCQVRACVQSCLCFTSSFYRLVQINSYLTFQMGCMMHCISLHDIVVF